MDTDKELTKVDIAVYALASLGGSDKTVPSEEIAARCYELAPNRFCWQLPHYRDKGWPDKYIAKTALEDAKKDEFGALVEGAYALDSAKDGWRLTFNGADWFNRNVQRIEKDLDVSAKGSTITKLVEKRFLSQVRSQTLYKRFINNQSLGGSSPYEFTDMLKCSPDVPKDIVKRKFERLRSTAVLVGDEEVLNFLQACAREFSFLLANRSDGE